MTNSRSIIEADIDVTDLWARNLSVCKLLQHHLVPAFPTARPPAPATESRSPSKTTVSISSTKIPRSALSINLNNKNRVPNHRGSVLFVYSISSVRLLPTTPSATAYSSSRRSFPSRTPEYPSAISSSLETPSCDSLSGAPFPISASASEISSSRSSSESLPGRI